MYQSRRQLLFASLFSPEKYWKFPEKFINSYPENAPLSAVFSRHAQFMRLCSQFRTNAPQFSHASIMAMCQNIEKMSDHRAYLTENMQALLSVLYDDVTRRHIRLKHALNFTENDTKAVQVDIPRLINRLLTAIDKNFSKIGSKMDFEQAHSGLNWKPKKATSITVSQYLTIKIHY